MAGEELYAFFKDVRDENLLGIDVDPAMINICNETLGRGIYKTANPQPPVEFISDNSLDIIFAYSVFSHLSEETAEHWIKEFSRILRPVESSSPRHKRAIFSIFVNNLRNTLN